MTRLLFSIFTATTSVMASAVWLPNGGLCHAAEIKVLSTNGVRGAVVELARRFESMTGHKVVLEFEVTAVVARRIYAGEAFDVAVLGRTQMENLVRKGRISEDTRVTFGRTGMGLAVRKGGPKPDISSPETLKQAMLSAKSIAFAAEGGSGREFLSLLDHLGIAAEMKSKIKAVGAPTIQAVINGDAEFVFSGVGLILADSAVELVGAIPPALQTYAVIAAGVNPGTKESVAARALITFFTDAAAAPVLKTYGVELNP